MSTVFTTPGKMGDALLQWPVAYHWAKQSGKKFDIWMDEKTCAPLVPLFSAQECTGEAKLVSGIVNYGCGGQPFHFDLPTSAFEGNSIYHLGLRGFPIRQITLETMMNAKVPVEVSQEVLASEPSIVIPDVAGKVNRLVLHAQPVYSQNKNTPTVWKFVSGIRKELEALFSEIVFVGNERDLEVGARTYPSWGTFDDGGDFLKLGRYIAESKAMIGCGSAPIALAGALKIPAIRVHDQIANNSPRVIWSNLGDNQLNESEVDLRGLWPEFRGKWLLDSVAETT